MSSASLSRPLSCKERPTFLPAASTFLPAFLKASSRRAFRSSELSRFDANFHRLEELQEPEITIMTAGERPVNRAFGLCTWEGTGRREGKPAAPRMASE